MTRRLGRRRKMGDGWIRGEGRGRELPLMRNGKKKKRSGFSYLDFYWNGEDEEKKMVVRS